MSSEKIIGIVGGVGPYAGLDLAKKIFDQTKAKSDQEHLPIALLSIPQQIEDRTAFLLNETNINPANAIFTIIRKLEQIGADIIGIACNTAHTPEIFDTILKKLNQANSGVRLFNMIKEVAAYIRTSCSTVKDIGILCTTGAYKTRLYQNILEPEGFNVIMPDQALQDSVVNKAIYEIKAQSNPVTEAAEEQVLAGIEHLQKKGAQAIVLGCTELGLAVSAGQAGETVIIDPALILARALIKAAAPHKLRP